MERGKVLRLYTFCPTFCINALATKGRRNQGSTQAIRRPEQAAKMDMPVRVVWPMEANQGFAG
jgi:hypothetical protein